MRVDPTMRRSRRGSTAVASISLMRGTKASMAWRPAKSGSFGAHWVADCDVFFLKVRMASSTSVAVCG